MLGQFTSGQVWSGLARSDQASSGHDKVRSCYVR